MSEKPGIVLDVIDVGRTLHVKVNLDYLTSNVELLRNYAGHSTGLIGVVKAGAFGHGSIHVSKHLKDIGVERLAVATVDEGVHLRKHGILGPIHVFGNTRDWEMKECVLHRLIPTISSVQSVVGMYETLKNVINLNDDTTSVCSVQGHQIVPAGSINIKVDTGLSRNGCFPRTLPDIVEKCKELNVPIDAIFTQFSDSIDNCALTKEQYNIFLETIQPFRNQGFKFHVANTGAVLNKIGVDLDFIRPGIALYGLPAGGKSDLFQALGFKPIASIHGTPTLVKQMAKDTPVGYGAFYTTRKDGEWMAIIPDGYADGCWRHMDHEATVIREKTGEKCRVLGRISMDAMIVGLPENVREDEMFTLMSADYDKDTSASGIAARVGTIAYEIATRMSIRYPRVYTKGVDYTVVRALQPESY